MMKKKNIILLLILIVLSIFLVQYWSKKQVEDKEERLEQIEKGKAEQEKLEKLEKGKTEQEELEKLEKEKAEQEELEKLEKEKAGKEELEKLEKEKVEKKETSFTWHTDVNKAIKISIQTGKPLFFFFTGSDWCGWCKRLVKEVFIKPEFAAWATKTVVLVELDFPRRTPISADLKKQNSELGKMFGVRGYPTVWFVTPEITDGKVNFNKKGSQGYVAGGPKAWIAGTNKILKNK